MQLLIQHIEASQERVHEECDKITLCYLKVLLSCVLCLIESFTFNYVFVHCSGHITYLLHR